MTTIHATLTSLLRGEVATAVDQRIEAEIEKYVGTGMDLGVIRDRKCAMRGTSVEMTVSLTFFPVQPGVMPDVACTIYRVSALGEFSLA